MSDKKPKEDKKQDLSPEQLLEKEAELKAKADAAEAAWRAFRKKRLSGK